jgi:hypothetical protein
MGSDKDISTGYQFCLEFCLLKVVVTRWPFILVINLLCTKWSQGICTLRCLGHGPICVLQSEALIQINKL